MSLGFPYWREGIVWAKRLRYRNVRHGQAFQHRRSAAINIALGAVRGHLSAKDGDGKCFAAALWAIGQVREMVSKAADVVANPAPNAATRRAAVAGTMMVIDTPDDDDVDPMPVPRRGLLGMVEDRLLGLAEAGKAELVGSLAGLVELAHELAGHAEATAGGTLGGYPRQAADRIAALQAHLRDRPVIDLLDDGRDIVRNSPGIALAAALVAGFVAARIAKAGSR